jgi:hypothetical protein
MLSLIIQVFFYWYHAQPFKLITNGTWSAPSPAINTNMNRMARIVAYMKWFAGVAYVISAVPCDEGSVAYKTWCNNLSVLAADLELALIEFIRRRHTNRKRPYYRPCLTCMQRVTSADIVNYGINPNAYKLIKDEVHLKHDKYFVKPRNLFK